MSPAKPSPALRGFWHASRWRIDSTDLVMPNGWRIPLIDVLRWREDLITGNADLTGRWSGWRVRQQWLIAPGGSLRHHRIAEHVMLRHISQLDWERKEISRRQMALFPSST
jgi:hypothetical protein